MRTTLHTWVEVACLGAAVAAFASRAAAAPPALRVSDNKRFLVEADGKPFFYLGDTAWELFHRLNREEADRYLENRAKKGFTVIQAVALAELDGHTDPIGSDSFNQDLSDRRANTVRNQLVTEGVGIFRVTGVGDDPA